MKLSIALLSAAIALSAAQPHRHHIYNHSHRKRDPVPDPAAADYAAPAPAEYPTNDGPTVLVYIMNGKPISEDEVHEGLKNGTLVVASDGKLSSKRPEKHTPPTPPPKKQREKAKPAPAPKPAPEPVVKPAAKPAPKPIVKPAPKPIVKPAPKPAVPQPKSEWKPSPPAHKVALPKPTAPSYQQASGDETSGVDVDFPDGELDCDTFPSDYGAVPVEWLGLSGWTGVQCPGSSDEGGYSNIETIKSGGGCTEGSFCSYACPAGYQKAQWPTTQGSTGQSVGGIHCKNGKLWLTNPEMCSKLCMPGTDKVTVLVKNTLSDNVAVCRTDYPGTESETVPVNVGPDETSNLTCPDADNYYNWQGKSTSAQYYVNPAGVAVEDACQWGSPENPWGNFAPMNLGVGYSNGAAWLSIFQNSPTTDAKLEFSVEIIGDGVSGCCKYSDGQYCGGADGTDCSSSTGCTVRINRFHE